MKRILASMSAFLMLSCGGSPAPLSPPEPVSPPLAESTLEPLLPQPAADNFIVAGYFPDYRELNPAWALSLTDIIYFSAEPRADGSLDTSRLSEETWLTLAKLKSDYGVRVHVSFGGWKRDGAFAEMTADPETRKTFVENLLEFLLSRNLDGVDFDWEFPATDTQFDNYISLLAETKDALSAHGLLVSVALPAESDFPLGRFAVVDRIHLMSYDRGERHSTYEQAVDDVQAFLSAGIPPEKLILGMPFYGRTVAPPHDEYPYAQLISEYSPVPAVDEVNGIYFNGLATIQRKVCYGMSKGLGGFMVWELSQDTTDASSLLLQIFDLVSGEETC